MNEKERWKIMALADRVQLSIYRLMAIKGLDGYDSTCINIKSDLNELLDIIYESKFKEDEDE